MSNYLWHEVSKGQWERNLDEAEIFYASLQKIYEATGRMFFAITGHVSIELTTRQAGLENESQDEIDEALRQAWLQLRYSHPTIAASTKFDSTSGQLKKVYECPSSLDNGSLHEAWLRTTFQKIAISESSLDWCNQDPPAPELATIFILASTVKTSVIRRTIVLRSPHDIVDGIGTLQILGIYLKYVGRILDGEYIPQHFNCGSEHQNLTPPLRIAAKIPDEPSNEVTAAYEKLKIGNAQIASNGLPVITVPCVRSAEQPSKHQRTALCLPSEQTAAIVQACKSKSASITHVYHAAAAIVLANKQPRTEMEQQMQYVTYALINLRAQCEPPFNSSDHTASVYHCVSAEHLSIPFTIPPKDLSPSNTSSEFGRVLSDMKAYYIANRPSTEPMLLQLASLLWHESTPKISNEDWTASQPMPIPPPNTKPSISMSSFGIVEKMIPAQIGRLAVHNPWVTGEELGNGIGLFLGTFRGELELSAAFNAAWHDTAEIQAYLDEIQAVVETGLGIH